MNKWLRTICAGTFLVTMVTASAVAADFTQCADHLNQLGLFQGTDQGYQLDRAPTRGEAAAMLVRLLGKEDEAKSLSYSAPFTDLQEWEKPYVQYLYDNKLTTGVTATQFKPRTKCTAQMYAAFLLRALHYTEADGDFTYANAVHFAQTLGLYDPTVIDTEAFLRDHVAAASYTALALQPKGETESLLACLVVDGAVDAEAAAPYKARFSVYNQYLSETNDMNGLTALSVNHKIKVQADTFTLTAQEETAMDFAHEVSLTKRAATLAAEKLEDKTILSERYIADGYSYVKQNGVRSRRVLTPEQVRFMFTGYGRVPMALVEDITVSDHTYAIRYNNAGIERLAGLLDAVQSAVGSFEGMQIRDLSVKHSASAGKITLQNVYFTFQSENLSGIVESQMSLRDMNGAVNIIAPDNLEYYPLID